MSIAPPRHERQRPIAAWALFMLTTLLASGCGGGSSSSAPAAGNDAALQASQPGELLKQVQSLLRARDQERQTAPDVPVDSSPVPGAALPVSAAGAAVAFSNTTVQEAGVDEEDLLKTDGTSVYGLDAVSRAANGAITERLLVSRRNAAGDVVPVQVLDLPADASTYPIARGLLLAAPAHRLVALSESLSPIGDPIPCTSMLPCPLAGAAAVYMPIAMQSKVQLQFVDLDAAGNATLGKHVAIDGRLIGSRLIGNVLFLVTTHAPRLAFDLLPSSATTDQKEATLAKMTTADFLPTWKADSAAAEQLVADTDCYVQPMNASLGLEITTISAIDMATFARTSRCFVGGTETLYMAPKSLYVATTRFPSILLPTGLRQFSPSFMTDIHKFSVDGMAINYRASGSVRGNLGWDAQRMPYRMGEQDSDLRVLTFTGQTGWVSPDDPGSATPPSPATLTVLRESAVDRTLVTLATLPNDQHPEPLGKVGEQVHAVRFVGARGYLVTFRTIDPLYVLDLSNPTDPRTAGSLDVAGFSDYLFPLSDALLFGVGRSVDASGRAAGIQLGVFDVSDASHPTSVATTTFGVTGSQTALDYSSHGFNWMQVGNVARIGLPVVVRADPFDANPQHGLQRIEVDTSSKAMTLKALLAAPIGPTLYPDVSNDRSVQLGSKLVYLSEGQIVVADW
jgi:hypothetical protein